MHIRSCMKVYVISAFLLILGTHLFASQYAITQYDAAYGLKSRSVIMSTGDSKGSLWVAHNDGIQRFDGEQFVEYKLTDSDGLQQTNVKGVVSSQDKSIVITYTNKYVYCYNYIKDCFDLIDIKLNRYIISIQFNSKSEIFIITHTNIYKLSKDRALLSSIYAAKHKEIIRVAFGANDDIWIGTKNGVKKIEINPKDSLYTNVVFSILPESYYLQQINL